mmetsp:Transcript_11343/g.30217  ORF Transcript_11343/g.30217 Transcript_11343/m.30217 type:complete len:307 (+) Transcript_11343:714-1634(+)
MEHEPELDERHCEAPAGSHIARLRQASPYMGGCELLEHGCVVFGQFDRLSSCLGLPAPDSHDHGEPRDGAERPAVVVHGAGRAGRRLLGRPRGGGGLRGEEPDRGRQASLRVLGAILQVNPGTDGVRHPGRADRDDLPVPSGGLHAARAGLVRDGVLQRGLHGLLLPVHSGGDETEDAHAAKALPGPCQGCRRRGGGPLGGLPQLQGGLRHPLRGYRLCRSELYCQEPDLRAARHGGPRGGRRREGREAAGQIQGHLQGDCHDFAPARLAQRPGWEGEQHGLGLQVAVQSCQRHWRGPRQRHSHSI